MTCGLTGAPGAAADLPQGVVPAPAGSAPRLTLRYRLPRGGATDVVASVLHADADGLLVLPDDGPVLSVPRQAIILTRSVPPRAVRPTSRPADLERLAARGWPGIEQARLGGWLLRAGGGWTGRANSALVAGEPGRPLAEALQAVVQFYRDRSLPPRLHLPWAVGTAPETGAGFELSSLLQEQGWRPHDETLMLTADLRQLDLGEPRRGEPMRSVWSSEPSTSWLGVLRRGSAAADPAAAAVLRAAPADYLALKDSTDTIVAVGRVTRTQDWCGLGAIEVAAPWRGQGLGHRVSQELLRRGLEQGARFGYLQTQRENPVALGLYESLGFAIHHTYHYRRLDPPTSIRD